MASDMCITTPGETAAQSHNVSSVEKDVSRPMLTETARRQLTAWNDTRQVYPADALVPQLIAEQAMKTPEAIALMANGQEISYGALNRRANQLAHYLQALGVKPGVLVGCCVERSVAMVVGLLGILKAGGTYVPLDPAYPAERLSFMLEDAQASVLLTRQSLLPRLSHQKAKTVCLDSEAETLEQQSESEPPFTARGCDLAYVIYTSGSTGQPKGVKIAHESLLNLIYWHRQAFGITPADRATQVTSPAFDATGWELWPYLTAGASVHKVDEEIRTSPLLLRDWLISQHITITFLPTALAENILTLDWPSPTSLRYLLTGADTLHTYPPTDLPFTFVNNYGPTEATVVATCGRIPPVEHGTKSAMPPSIGRPIANTQIYILDENLQQVAIGEPGELHIGGIGLAQGYLNRPELTREKFIPHPFSAEPGTRLYKTGDLARFLPDGQIAFMGRIDAQIKIRGYRIEPGEISAVLGMHPTIQTSVVVAREDAPGDRRLVAYIVAVPGLRPTADALQELLAQHLPDYMIPTSFVLLEALPQTPNGKIRHSALPPPDETNTLHNGSITPPGTPAEAQLVAILAPLLNLDRISIDDNFFMLGGHSLLGTQLITRVAEIFGVNLTLRSLFNAPTVRQLAAEIERLILAKLETLSDEEVQRLLEQDTKIA